MVLFNMQFLAIANDMPGGERVAYSIELNLFKAEASALSTSPLDFKRVPGAGRLLKEWKLVKVSEHVYEVSGIVNNDNSGMVEKDSAVFIGNIEVNDLLRLTTKTNVKGYFKFTIDNRTFENKKKDGLLKGFVLISQNKHEEKFKQETIYLRKKYLYFGESGVDLYRYEIPYH